MWGPQSYIYSFWLTCQKKVISNFGHSQNKYNVVFSLVPEWELGEQIGNIMDNHLKLGENMMKPYRPGSLPFTITIVLCINKIQCLPSSILQWANLITPSLKNNESMDAMQNRRCYCGMQSFPPWAQLYRGKEDNICQSIWDKSEVLLRTLWRTCQELGAC